MQDRPEAHELLEQLAAWLAGELRERVPREERFGVLVAANVAGIVAREIGPDAPPASVERERMERLLELAGESAEDDDDVRALQRRAAAAIRASSARCAASGIWYSRSTTSAVSHSGAGAVARSATV
jgi:hypothetical protein